MEFNEEKFFDGYRSQFKPLTQPQVDALKKLLSFIKEDPEMTVLRWIAYCFATIKHECADTYEPITEYGPKSYFNKYEPGTKIGKNLGNTNAGDGYFFRGRGYVQLTGRANYKTMTAKLGLSGETDLVAHPDKALDPAIAYRIMSYGMRNGSYTGKALRNYLSDTLSDYSNARRIINSLDKAELIAGYARKFEIILKEAKI